MSSPDVDGIIDNAKELDQLRKQQEEILLEINKMHKKLQSTPEVVGKPGDNSLSRLKMLYTQAKDLSESEVSIYTQLIGQLDALMPSGSPGQQRRRIEPVFNEEPEVEQGFIKEEVLALSEQQQEVSLIRKLSK